jgi:hypothetical protein
VAHIDYCGTLLASAVRKGSVSIWAMRGSKLVVPTVTKHRIWLSGRESRQALSLSRKDAPLMQRRRLFLCGGILLASLACIVIVYKTFHDAKDHPLSYIPLPPLNILPTPYGMVIVPPLTSELMHK